MGRNCFIFQFSDRNGAEQVLKESPWTINGKNMVVKEWRGDQKLEQISLSHMEIWVQFHGLMLNQMTDKNKKKNLGK